MGLEYYAFALFIAGLVSLIAVLFKVLFSNVKRQYKILDEKESKILQLYQKVESIMDEWSDQVKLTMDEIREHEKRAELHAASITKPPAEPRPAQEAQKPEQPERAPRAERVDSTRIRAASEVLARAERIIKSDTLKNPAVTVKSTKGAVFQRLFDETASENQNPQDDATSQKTRHDAILLLAQEGKTDAQIASELGITQNEVKLVIGLNGRK